MLFWKKKYSLADCIISQNQLLYQNYLDIVSFIWEKNIRMITETLQQKQFILLKFTS